jgi:hypothetical protein
VHVAPTHWLLTHVMPPGHGLHVTTLPQPSLTCPHCAPCCAHVFAEQLAAPQTFALPPPPHVMPSGQSGPQSRTPLQPSGIFPQFFPIGHCVSGVHAGAPHTFGVPPPPHV